MSILMVLFVICLGATIVIGLVTLIWTLVAPIQAPSASEKQHKSMRTQPVRYIMDEEDYELSPCELVMKYKIPLTDAEFDRLCFNREYAHQLMDAHFVQQQRDDMDSAMRMHQMAVDAHCMAQQQSADFHNCATEMAQQHAQIHNDMFAYGCGGNPFV